MTARKLPRPPKVREEGEPYLEDVYREAYAIPSGRSAEPNPVRVLVERPVRVPRGNRGSRPAAGDVFS